MSAITVPMVVDPTVYETPPQQETAGSAGIDLRAAERVYLDAGEVKLVPLGVRVAIPPGYVGLLYIRSSMPLKRGLSLANGVGVIDSDYRGDVGALIQARMMTLIVPGERIAQLVIVPCPRVSVEVVEALDETVRGDGGFGSTGTGVVR